MTLSAEHITVWPTQKTGAPILEDIDCAFHPGTLTLIVGQTGSGKTALLNALAGLTPLHAGIVRYGMDSVWSGRRSNEAVKFKAGLVFQYPERQLFAESIRKEFAYSLRPLRLSKQEKKLRIHQAMEEMQLPQQLLDQSLFALSDGQKRKIAIAATLAVRPDWLLLDEPTAGIDPQSVPLLLNILKSRKSQTDGGVVVVSHDLDSFLPIADRVLVLSRGRLIADVKPQELCFNPEILLQANVGLPSSIQINCVLQQHGIFLQETSFSPEKFGDAILKQVKALSVLAVGSLTSERQLHSYNGDPAIHERIIAAAANLAESAVVNPVPALSLQKRSAAATTAQQLHPTAKWLLYLLLSSGILLQDHWLGIGFATGITLACIVRSGVSYRILLKPAKPLLIFIIISGIISGLTIEFIPSTLIPQHFDFSLFSANRTVMQLSGIFLIMLLGVLFAATTGGRMMQRGLEQALSFLEKWRLPVSVFTFSAALLLKFIPLLFAEMERMSLITRARGKSNVKEGSLRLRDVPVFMIPLILSLMKHAEDLAFALEARGYRLKRLIGASAGKIRWKRADWFCAIMGLISLGVLIVLAR